jgi:apolipoprotein N-acyltransferase
VFHNTIGYLKDSFLVIISSLLLVLSFSNFDLGSLVWVGLVPFFLAVSGKRPVHGFTLSTICGIFFFMGIFSWILAIPNYSLIHHAILAIYLGLYFGFLGLIFNFISARCGLAPALIVAPFIWVSLEYVRANFSFLALPWGLLGHTQYQHPLVIQIAALVGTYGVSFLIVMVNSAIVSLTYPYFRRLTATSQFSDIIISIKPNLPLIIIAALLTVFTLTYGYVITSRPIIGKRIRISAVQGNIEQAKKWDTKYANDIMRTYTAMTCEAVKERPALIVWPETATPRSLSLDSGLHSELRNLVKKTSVPLLTGSAEYQKFEKTGGEKNKYFNSAILFNSENEVVKTQRYDKMRLFPFSEYLPFKEIFPWPLIKVPMIGQYLPGEKYTVFELPVFRFGVTICWENIFAGLVRQLVRRGAEVIVNITNEARFGKTAAPYQLAAISVFRAVENRVFVIRCANTGVSCIIDPFGRIVNRLKDDNGQDIFIRGVMNGWIIPLESKTIYTKYGELAAWASLLGSLLICMFVCCIRRPQSIV